MAPGTTTKPKPKASSYELRISPTTVDKLGVKLYDKASAVVAELIANAYDADAPWVEVEVPLGVALATRSRSGEIRERGYTIVVRDGGIGMTPEQAQKYFLDVGRDRRLDPERGATSPGGRRVMGRKGIGKLAPFGICRRIEVLSSGGKKTSQGYLTSHFFVDFDDIMNSEDDRVPLDAGNQDGSYAEARGTTVTLHNFVPKRVPDRDTFTRQLARRFALSDPNFKIYVVDIEADEDDSDRQFEVPPFQVETLTDARITVDDRPVEGPDGEHLPVTGWLGLAKQAYRNEEMAGVRIYARGKIVATTRDFELPAGFTGEFTIRSYLVGEIHAEWLDADDGDDLVRTDRQGILWDSDLGQALQQWGSRLIKELGESSREPRRRRVRDIFFDKSRFKERAEERYQDPEVIEAAVGLARRVAEFASEDELEDPNYIDSLAEVILTMAPHHALIEAFRSIASAEADIDDILVLLGKTRVAELASYGQLALERVRSIRELEEAIGKSDADEAEYQSIIARAPWLVQPDWAVITENQALSTFRRQLESFIAEHYEFEVEIAISYERKRPDFTLIAVGRLLHIVEIKPPRHTFGNDDYDRLANYLEAFEQFEEENPGVLRSFADGWVIDLVADRVDIRNRDMKRAYKREVERGRIVQTTWRNFLLRATVAHQQFLDAHDRAHQDEP